MTRSQRERYVIVAAVVFLLATGVTGCASRALYQPGAEAMQLQLRPTDYQTIGPVSGKSCADEYFIFAAGKPDVLDAEQSALLQAPGANLLINKYVYTEDETVIPVVLSRQCFYVEGTAIKLLD